MSLSEEETRTLREKLTRTWRADLGEALLMGLARALRSWTGGHAHLIDFTREGRRREFAEHGWSTEDVPDPQDEQTFRSSTLTWKVDEELRRMRELRAYLKKDGRCPPDYRVR